MPARASTTSPRSRVLRLTAHHCAAQGAAVGLAQTTKRLLRPGGSAIFANHGSWFTPGLRSALSEAAAAAGLEHCELPDVYAEAVFIELRQPAEAT